MPNKLMNKGQKTAGFAPSSLILTNYFPLSKALMSALEL